MATDTSTTKECKISFKNSSGDLLSGILVDVGSSDAAILCHGYADTKNGFHLPKLAQALVTKGCSTLRFDFTGNGESEGHFRYGNYAAEAEDVRCAIGLLHSHGKTVKAILGHSKGGDTVVTYAGTYDDIPKVVNVSGRFHLERGITPRFGKDIFDRLKQEKTIQVRDATVTSGPDGWTLTEEDMHERVSHDMRRLSDAIKKSSVLTIHGGADKTIPIADALEFAKHIRNHQLTVIDGASHNYDKPQHAQQLIQLAVDFMTAA
ncbi:hypothetical protein WJX77_012021 [Trebouxia sp. C0004]